MIFYERKMVRDLQFIKESTLTNKHFSSSIQEIVKFFANKVTTKLK